MSVLGIALGIAGLGGGGLGLAVAKLGARVVFGKIGSAVRAGADKAKAVDWGKVYRTVALFGLPVALFLAAHEWGEARHAGKQLEAEQKRVAGLVRVNAAEVAAHLVTKRSLTGALGQIADNNHRIDAANAELVRERQEWAAKDAANSARFKVTAATVAQLERSAAGPRSVPCKLTDAAAKALEGL